MDQTDRNALDYESCRRVWRRVSPELDPYPEEKEATDCPAAPAPDLKGLQEMIEGELGDRRAYLEAARRAPNPAARRMMQRMADREGAHARRLLAVYYLACGQCYRPALASGPGETLPWRQLLRQRGLTTGGGPAAVTVTFGPPPREGLPLYLTPDCALRQEVRYAWPDPSQTPPPEGLLSLLHRACRLPEICVKSVETLDRSRENHYNAT